MSYGDPIISIINELVCDASIALAIEQHHLSTCMECAQLLSTEMQHIRYQRYYCESCHIHHVHAHDMN